MENINILEYLLLTIHLLHVDIQYYLINALIYNDRITKKNEGKSYMMHDILLPQTPVGVVNRWSNSHTLGFGAVQEIFHQHTGLLQTSWDQPSYVIKRVKAF